MMLHLLVVAKIYIIIIYQQIYWHIFVKLSYLTQYSTIIWRWKGFFTYIFAYNQ